MELKRELEEIDADYWCPPLDRRTALRLLAMTSMAAATGCGSSGAAATAASSTSTGTTATTTTLSASSTSVAQAVSVTLTAAVSPSVATGTVTFYDGTTVLGTATLSNGTATLATSFSTTGAQSLTAVYGGSSTYATSTSAAISVTVTASTTSCTSTLEGEEGPYFVDDSASGYNRTNILSNLDGTETQPGIPLALTIYVFDSKNTCGPMQNVQVDIWHCNAYGVYSAESVEGTVGQSWLRGYQLTDATGKVSFSTILPGWYQGRTTHIHMRFRSTYDTSSTGETNTAQLFFDQTLVDTVDTTISPYSTEGKNTTTNVSDHVYTGEEKGTTLVTLTGSTSSGYTTTFNAYMPISS